MCVVIRDGHVVMLYKLLVGRFVLHVGGLGYWIPLVSIQNAVNFHFHGTAVPSAAGPQQGLYRWEQHPVCLEVIVWLWTSALG